jgi:hypothetical protein
MYQVYARLRISFDTGYNENGKLKSLQIAAGLFATDGPPLKKLTNLPA